MDRYIVSRLKETVNLLASVIPDFDIKYRTRFVDEPTRALQRQKFSCFDVYFYKMWFR